MEAYLVDWLNLLGRWLHVITGIAWIGSSFYFVWLDNHLQPPAALSDDDKGVGGELWSVHGGGFYHAQKYRVAPAVLPQSLHWFKWEAYSTWMSGMFLLALIYWYGADIYLIDRSVADLSPAFAVVTAILIIAGGWFVYDLLCRSPLGANENALAGMLLLLCGVLAWGLCELYSGRGAYIHFGSVLGTIMVANVFFVIIPGQRQMVHAAARGEPPDPMPGIRAKQRSVHNTYFTLPVLFVMTSNHFAVTYNHKYNWLILIAISIAGALIRVHFVMRHKGRPGPAPLLVAALLLGAVIVALAPRSSALSVTDITIAEVRPVIHTRCTICHSSRPTHVAFPSAPAGVELDTDQQIVDAALRIHQQTVVMRAMPIGNLSEISEDERQLIDAWYRGGARQE
ncbi:MAG: urate hydroxylase PuuD [Gammaproteobacteria bacterium]|nr:urate hydroxylase PuuD [Gammaproteobacteria bacterium]MDH4314030.1 urate hydroxylase PuuD [Gammaproteobacteria bacterium]MDH5213530.1 urate hydroxylase PuuD [Gammaproteobacteria bacterium]MDH5501874.1 urate hydroxylase PuuD [Gammaproteobacteria bacterium]